MNRCPYCGKIISKKANSSGQLALHVKNYHGKIWEGSLKLTLEKHPPQKAKNQCIICGDILDDFTLKTMLNHLKKGHPNMLNVETYSEAKRFFVEAYTY